MGEEKTTSARQACWNLNSDVQVDIYSEGLFPENVLEVIEKYDVVVDASDNAPTRYLIRYASNCLAGNTLSCKRCLCTDCKAVGVWCGNRDRWAVDGLQLWSRW